MNEVALTLPELLLGASAGAMRQVENIKLGRKAAFGAGHDNDWQLNIEGVLGEMALAKYLNRYWSGKGTFRAPDVDQVDVRTTAHPKGHLLIHKEDPDDRRFYLLRGACGSYEVCGWILGRDAKQDRFWGDKFKTGRPAYWVPQTELRTDE